MSSLVFLLRASHPAHLAVLGQQHTPVDQVHAVPAGGPAEYRGWWWAVVDDDAVETMTIAAEATRKAYAVGPLRFLAELDEE